MKIFEGVALIWAGYRRGSREPVICVICSPVMTPTVDEVGTPGPPWRVRMSSLIWWHAATPAAGEALPVPLVARKGRGVTSAGFIRYADTPVGPYDEVMGVPVSVQGGRLGRVHIPFIAVDSLPSVHAGRAHWALPKVFADFSGSPADEVRASGDGWWLSARIVRRGPPIPLLGRSSAAQVWPDGRVGSSSVSMYGRGRLVTVEVDVDPDASFASWLRPGRHRGIAASKARLTMGAPRWS
jgi:hypothetical protein